MSDLNSELNKNIVYDIPEYEQEEEIEFMIPIYTPDNESYEIEVTAYKKGRVLTEDPALTTVGVKGSILDDIRTRLR